VAHYRPEAVRRKYNTGLFSFLKKRMRRKTVKMKKEDKNARLGSEENDLDTTPELEGQTLRGSVASAAKQTER
jgi:hypothetical protein